jgi:hypothetical protein
MENNHARTYGLLCLAGGLLNIALGIAATAFPRTLGAAAEPVSWYAILLAIMHALTLAGVIGLARSGVAGTGPLGKVGLLLAGLGTAAAVVAEPMFLGPSGVAEPLIQFGTLIAALGLVMAGIAVWRGRRWIDARRYVPLALGLYFLVVFMPLLIAAGEPNFLVLGGWGVLWALLGLSLLREINAAAATGDTTAASTGPQPREA